MHVLLALTPQRPRRPSGLLAAALLASLALHAGVLLWAPGWEVELPQDGASLTLTASLQPIASGKGPLPDATPAAAVSEPPAVLPSKPASMPAQKEAAPAHPPVAAAPAQTKAAPDPIPKPRTPASRKLERAPTEAPAAKPQPPKPATDARTVTTESASAQEAPREEASLASVGPRTDATGARETGSEEESNIDGGTGAEAIEEMQSVESVSVADYRSALNRAAGKYRDYPRYARQREWEGAARLRLEIDAEGRLRDIRVLSSSGHAVLDDSATTMMRKAQRDTPVPPSLRGRAFSVEVAVLYELRE